MDLDPSVAPYPLSSSSSPPAQKLFDEPPPSTLLGAADVPDLLTLNDADWLKLFADMPLPSEPPGSPVKKSGKRLVDVVMAPAPPQPLAPPQPPAEPPLAVRFEHVQCTPEEAVDRVMRTLRSAHTLGECDMLRLRVYDRRKPNRLDHVDTMTERFRAAVHAAFDTIDAQAHITTGELPRYAQHYRFDPSVFTDPHNSRCCECREPACYVHLPSENCGYAHAPHRRDFYGVPYYGRSFEDNVQFSGASIPHLVSVLPPYKPATAALRLCRAHLIEMLVNEMSITFNLWTANQDNESTSVRPHVCWPVPEMRHQCLGEYGRLCIHCVHRVVAGPARDLEAGAAPGGGFARRRHRGGKKNKKGGAAAAKKKGSLGAKKKGFGGATATKRTRCNGDTPERLGALETSAERAPPVPRGEVLSAAASMPAPATATVQPVAAFDDADPWAEPDADAVTEMVSPKPTPSRAVRPGSACATACSEKPVEVSRLSVRARPARRTPSSSKQ